MAADNWGRVHSCVLNPGTDQHRIAVGYRVSSFRSLLFWLSVVLTCGILLLVTYWKPVLKLYFTSYQSPLSNADTLLITDKSGDKFVEKVILEEVASQSSGLEDYTYAQPESSFSRDANDRTKLTSGIPTQCLYLRYVDHHHVRYIWNEAKSTFSALRGLDSGITCATIHDKCHGLTAEQRNNRLMLYGVNDIPIDVKSYLHLMVEEVLNPFYIFQIFSIILWSMDEYYVYASCILLISVVSLGISLYETRKQSQTLHDMVSSSDIEVTTIRPGGELLEVSSLSLVPGDMLVLPSNGCHMMCDAVLISGNVIVNESMLTGESVPVTKTPLIPSEAEEVYSPDDHKRHTLFCGTKVIQTRYYGEAKVCAVVVRTGFSTAKGDLVRSILFPRPVGLKFYEDALRFVGLLAVIATLGMIYSSAVLIKHGTLVSKIIIRALDIVTIVVPPALPAAMTVGTVYAQNRLKKQGIFCISPPRINFCGRIKLVCFDKTGTLTEEGLDLMGVLPIKYNRFITSVQNPEHLPSTDPFIVGMATCHSLTRIDNELTGDPMDLKMFNSINWVLEEPGRDTSKFDILLPTVVRPSNKTSYSSEQDPPFEVGIVRQFTFSSSLQRMSVVTRTLGEDHMVLYAKGAPEKIISLCQPHTVPDDFSETLRKHTLQGFRVIALAWKPLDHKLSWHQVQRAPRNTIECELQLLGLLVMENMLKPQTTPVIDTLHRAAIRTVMATGDNILTGVSVARQCGMVGTGEQVVMVTAHPPEDGLPARLTWEATQNNMGDLADVVPLTGEENDSGDEIDTSSGVDGIQGMAEVDLGVARAHERYQTMAATVERGEMSFARSHLALTGKTFSLIREHFADLLPKIYVQGTVFARMSPDQKSQLVEGLQGLGYCVGMCGDGANDCGALKTAHAGISLSEAEASVASPFTAREANIECIPTLIKEGRAALVTTFGVFKYMALYSMIQFVSVMILYTNYTNMGDWMFLYIDLIITTTVAVLMGHSEAYSKLVAQRPTGSLVSGANVFSLISQILFVIIFQLLAYVYLISQTWFSPAPHGNIDNNVEVYETTIIFCVSAFQYLILAFVFSKGPPYRQPIWRNVAFLVALLILTGVSCLVLLKPFPFMAKFLQLKQPPDGVFLFRITLLGIIGIHFMLALLVEDVILPSRILRKILKRLNRNKRPSEEYKIVQAEILKNSSWPPVGKVTHATSCLEEDDTTACSIRTEQPGR